MIIIYFWNDSNIELIKDEMDWKMEKVRGKISISPAFETFYFSIKIYNAKVHSWTYLNYTLLSLWGVFSQNVVHTTSSIILPHVHH